MTVSQCQEHGIFRTFSLTLFCCFHLFHPTPTFFHLSFTLEKDNARVIQTHDVANTMYNYSGWPASRTV